MSNILTVGKLIKQLQNMPKNANIYISNHDYSIGQGDPARSVINMMNYDRDDDSEFAYIEGSSLSLCGTNSVVICS